MIIVPSNVGGTTSQSVTFKGATGTRNTSLALPSHAAGDIIVLAVYEDAANVLGSPSAGGTVPTWIDIEVNGRIRMVYAIATSSTTTSGTWGSRSDNAIIAAVLSGQGASPIGGKSTTLSSGSANITAPAVTMTNTDQTSQLLHFGFHERGNRTSGTFSTAGYTQRVTDDAIDGGYRLITKNDTATDGSVIVTAASGNTTWGAATVEIRI